MPIDDREIIEGMRHEYGIYESILGNIRLYGPVVDDIETLLLLNNTPNPKVVHGLLENLERLCTLVFDELVESSARLGVYINLCRKAGIELPEEMIDEISQIENNRDQNTYTLIRQLLKRTEEALVQPQQR